MWWGKQAAVLTGLALNLNPQRQASTVAPTLLRFHSPVTLALSKMVISSVLLVLPLRIMTLLPISLRKQKQVEGNCPHSAALLPGSPTCL